MAATPFSFSGALNLPGGPGLPNDAIPINLSSTFEHQTEFRLVLSGTGTHTVDLGTIAAPGVKGLLILLEAGATVQPVVVRINGQVSGGTEVSAGGFLALGSPVPVTGITEMELVHTSAATVRIWALG